MRALLRGMACAAPIPGPSKVVPSAGTECFALAAPDAEASDFQRAVEASRMSARAQLLEEEELQRVLRSSEEEHRRESEELEALQRALDLSAAGGAASSAQATAGRPDNRAAAGQAAEDGAQAAGDEALAEAIRASLACARETERAQRLEEEELARALQLSIATTGGSVAEEMTQQCSPLLPPVPATAAVAGSCSVELASVSTAAPMAAAAIGSAEGCGHCHNAARPTPVALQHAPTAATLAAGPEAGDSGDSTVTSTAGQAEEEWCLAEIEREEESPPLQQQEVQETSEEKAGKDEDDWLLVDALVEPKAEGSD